MEKNELATKGRLPYCLSSRQNDDNDDGRTNVRSTVVVERDRFGMI